MTRSGIGQSPTADFHGQKDIGRIPERGVFAGNILIINLTISAFQHQAIALSTSCTMFLNFLFLSAVLYWKIGGYSLRSLFKGLGKILIATAGMSLLLYGARIMLANFLVGNIIQQLLAVALLIFLAVCLYTVILHRLKLRELTEITAKIRARFS
jgi:putative peptidoglycan lipid II flippase